MHPRVDAGRVSSAPVALLNPLTSAFTMPLARIGLLLSYILCAQVCAGLALLALEMSWVGKLLVFLLGLAMLGFFQVGLARRATFRKDHPELHRRLSSSLIFEVVYYYAHFSFVYLAIVWLLAVLFFAFWLLDSARI